MSQVYIWVAAMIKGEVSLIHANLWSTLFVSIKAYDKGGKVSLVGIICSRRISQNISMK